MGEILRAVMTKNSVTRAPVVYTAETRRLGTGGVAFDTGPFFFYNKADSHFLCTSVMIDMPQFVGVSTLGQTIPPADMQLEVVSARNQHRWNRLSNLYNQFGGEGLGTLYAMPEYIDMEPKELTQFQIAVSAAGAMDFAIGQTYTFTVSMHGIEYNMPG